MAKNDNIPRHRSGVVADMLHMPVATLRVWERRYQVSKASLTAGGQRLYTAADIQRLAILKQLTDLGHAIGSLAALDLQQLLSVAATHASAENVSQAHRPAPEPPLAGAWRVAVIGHALGKRLQRPALQRYLKRPLVLLGPFDSAAQAQHTLGGMPVDLVLAHEPSLHADWLAGLRSEASSLHTTPKALVYGFAAEATCDALADEGVTLLREPQNDTVLAQWLGNLLAANSPQMTGNREHPPAASLTEPPSARRWTDAALTDFASLSSTIACECPSQVAQLLIQLSHFEAYSAACESRNPLDAAVHAYLCQTTATARSQFEQALAYVARHEGLALPGN